MSAPATSQRHGRGIIAAGDDNQHRLYCLLAD
jgi:hypothetical protein